MSLLDEFADYVEYGKGYLSPYFPLFLKTMDFKGQVSLAARVAEDMYRDGEPLTSIFRALTGATFDLSREVALTIIKGLEEKHEKKI